MNYSLIVFGGLVGGALRGLMGIAKGLITKKEESINYKYFFVSIGISAIVGLVASLMIPIDFKFAVLAGYAGSDFLESLYKIKLKQKFAKGEENEEEEGKESGFGKALEK